ncbi:hypothetical protein DIC66_13390 [Rhodoferax lacus]|uniref:Uncharacterized protein n=1 Tax=Rhodoferax lacus TaxID=2184758 RepID=A0A3E1RAQ0_9BURK|nr:hypothetical protein DIC66_13390 [Rhodoferax lacus]
MQPDDIPAPAQSYQQAMQNLNAIVVASPSQSGVVVLTPQQLTTVNTQAGQHYKLRRRGDNNLQTPDNVVAVRHGDDLHLRYADGSAVSFENFYSVCTNGSECSVDVAGDGGQSFSLSGANVGNGVVADDGLLVYAHGEHDVLMSMAQDQKGLSSAILGLSGTEEVTYLPPSNQAIGLALGAMALAALASSKTNSNSGNVPLGADAKIAGDAATRALAAISSAADNDSAKSTITDAATYLAAGVSGVSAENLGAVNSALDSKAITGANAGTAAQVQGIVNAYNAILSSADGSVGSTATPLTGAQYTAVGVTGVSGNSQPGNALHLLDSVVDVSAPTLVDTVPELQLMANAAAHVISGAAGGAAPSLEELKALGIVGVTDANLLSVQNAIANTADNGTGVDTQAALQIVVNGAVASHPIISTALGGVSNLDVSSDLVLTANQTVTLGTGFIHITDKGGSNGGTGYQSDTNTNNQDIDVASAVKSGLLNISGTGTNTKIIINPQWDLDLSSNYQISIDDTVFRNADGTQAAVPFVPINFSTVTPGTHTTGKAITEAAASQIMNDNTGLLVASKSWLDVQAIGNNTGSVAQLGTLSGGAFALVMKNYATTPGGPSGDGSDGMAAHDTFVGFTNFGADDVVYLDSQVNNFATQLFEGKNTQMTDGSNQTGGLTGQNALVFGEVNTPKQQGNQAMVLLGLENNTANTIYSSIYTFDANNIGWANVWHPLTAPVVMG